MSQRRIATGEIEQKIPGERLEGIEAMRFVGALLVVWIHTVTATRLDSLTLLGRFAVPFFTLSAVFFGLGSLRRQPNRAFSAHLRARFLRIYWPFLVWCALYLALWKARQQVIPGPLPVHEISTWPWIGTAFHLWFLPFIFTAAVAIFPVARLLARRPQWVGAFIAGGIFLGLGVALTPLSAIFPRDFTLGIWQKSWEALPSVFWGIAAFALWHNGGKTWIRARAITYLSLILCAAATLALFWTGRNFLLENLAGVGAFVAGLGHFQGRAASAMASGGALAFGIYLSHLAFVIVIGAVLKRLHVPETIVTTLFIFVFSVLCSAVFTRKVSQSRFKPMLLPG